jgi:hypothetical protein
MINQQVVPVYMIGVGIHSQDSNADDPRRSMGGKKGRMRLISKRYDEIVYLREKIASEFPHLRISKVPTPKALEPRAVVPMFQLREYHGDDEDDDNDDDDEERKDASFDVKPLPR